MAVLLTNPRVFVGGYDLTTDTSSLTLGATAEEKDVTAFGNAGYRTRVAGLREVTADLTGFLDYGTGEPDPLLFNNINVEDEVFTTLPAGNAVGDRGYTTTSIQGTFQTLGDVGEVAGYSASLRGRGQPLVQGSVLHPYDTARTTTVIGTAVNLGIVTTGKKVYAALHVLEVSGTTPTMQVILQSDDAQAFTTPTARITFATASAIGAQFRSLDGPITGDNWWRITATFTGTTPSFRFLVVAGVQ